MAKKLLTFWMEPPGTIKERGVIYKLYKGWLFSKKEAIREIRDIGRKGVYYFTTRRAKDKADFLGLAPSRIVIYVRKRYMGRGAFEKKISHQR